MPITSSWLVTMNCDCVRITHKVTHCVTIGYAHNEIDPLSPSRIVVSLSNWPSSETRGNPKSIALSVERAMVPRGL